MLNLAHIAEGWGKSLGLLAVSDECKNLSIERIAICAKCPFASESSMLKLMHGSATRESVIKCDDCGCPIEQKTLVTDEKCPQNKW